MTKSSYELRTELLNMAASILMAQHKAKYAKDMQELHSQASDPVLDFGAPTAPTADEIIDEAKKLNKFVQAL